MRRRATDSAVHLRDPVACSERERREFAHLVREGFGGAVGSRDVRIRDARWLAFHYADDGALVGVAALKAPPESYRKLVFEKADAPVGPSAWKLELGWVFVVPGHRRRGIAELLCRRLLERASPDPVFSTTRPDNVAMIRILRALGFERVGEPYARGPERLVLFLRS